MEGIMLKIRCNSMVERAVQFKMMDKKWRIKIIYELKINLYLEVKLKNITEPSSMLAQKFRLKSSLCAMV